MNVTPKNDMQRVLWVFGIAVVVIVLVAVLIPNHTQNDPRPRVDNNATAGAKAAFMLLPKLGYKVQKWEAAESDLENMDAAHTTLIMADVYVGPKALKPTQVAVQRFLERGGRVLDTGGDTLLPFGKTRAPSVQKTDLCYTVAEGQGALARAGQVSTADEGAWDEKEAAMGTALHVEQRCGEDAVVVSYKVGKGEAVWWSSSMPLSNAGLKEDGSLKLLLATVGEPGRTVLFDEFDHGEPRPGMWDAAKGLPLKWLFWQCVLLAGLLILSFSRRKGPIRMPVVVPRTSPVEFAESMGHLYERAGTTNAATGMARARLLRFLQNEGGLARVTIEHGPTAIAEALTARFGGEWTALVKHLNDATEAEHAELAPKSALRLVQALDEDVERLQRMLMPKQMSLGRETMAGDETAVLVSATKE